MALEAYNQAQEAFQHLLSDHPTSSFIPRAGHQLTLAHYRAGDYKSAVTTGKSALNLAENDTQRLRIHILLGNIYRAAGKFSNSVMSYIHAYTLAPPGKRPEILTNMKETIPSVETADLESFVETFRKRPPGGYLHFHLARRYADEGRIELALDVLSDFFKFFPNHEKLEDALAFREELKSRALVDRFLIGCILPLSGPYAAFGERALTGIELALNLFNAQVHTHPVQLAVKDSKGDPNEAVAALKALTLNEGVIGIIGPMITSESVALEAQALKIPIVTLTQKGQIPSLGDYVFRNFLTPLSQVETIVSYSVKDLGFDRFAILYPEEPYGTSFMNSFWDALIRHGAHVVGVESYKPEQTDFNEEIRKLVGLYYPRPELEEKAWSDGEVALWNTLRHLHRPTVRTSELETPGDPDEATVFEQEPPRDEDDEPDPIIDFQAVFIPDSYGKVGLITPQLLYHGVEDVLLLGCNLWHSPELIRMAHEYVQDAVIAEGFFAQSPLPRVVNFVSNYKRIFESTPGYLEAQAYDTAWILSQATNTPKVNSRMSLKRTLAGLTGFPGVTGITSFDENGEVNKDTYLLKIRGRQFIQIRP
jgi:ABC-type branched-subunit amino acid transport system substrate-binding protein